jgi:hypothetical protein
MDLVSAVIAGTQPDGTGGDPFCASHSRVVARFVALVCDDIEHFLHRPVDDNATGDPSCH